MLAVNILFPYAQGYSLDKNRGHEADQFPIKRQVFPHNNPVE